MRKLYGNDIIRIPSHLFFVCHVKMILSFLSTFTRSCLCLCMFIMRFFFCIYNNNIHTSCRNQFDHYFARARAVSMREIQLSSCGQFDHQPGQCCRLTLPWLYVIRQFVNLRRPGDFSNKAHPDD